ncbi:MAG TPA: diacylglycerol kinase family protein [Myxococcales bacterium]|nr:diacylglycerol kinase family protein [Myxococcales bacterium]
MSAAIVAVVNPKSAGGATGRKWPELAGPLSQALGNVEAVFTDAPNAATRLTRQALQAGAKLLISVGGDGTHNEVANGFFEGDRRLAPEAVMGMIPAGTGGDFRRSFGWSTDAREAIARLATKRVRRIDVGRLGYVAADGTHSLRHFVNIASFGIGGQVDNQVVRAPKLFGGKAAFAIASLRALSGWRDQKVTLSIDGGEPSELGVTSVSVCNGQYFGGGMWAAPEAKLDDGLFDVVVWQGLGLSDFVLRSKRLYDGSHVRMPQTTVKQARSVKADSAETVLLDVDGEQPGRLPATFELLPLALGIQG